MLIANVPDKAAGLRQCWHYIEGRLGADAVHVRKVRADAEIAPLIASLGLPKAALEALPPLVGRARAQQSDRTG